MADQITLSGVPEGFDAQAILSEIAGEMMPFNIGLLTCEYGRYDLNDPKVQLFYMITLLEPGWRFSQSLCDTQ